MSRRATDTRRRAVLQHRSNATAASRLAMRMAKQGRAAPVSRDLDLVQVVMQPALVERAERMFPEDHPIYDWVAERLADNKEVAGRPAALSVRQALICFWLQVRVQRNLHLVNLPALLDGLPGDARRRLGLDFTDRHGVDRQVSYDSFISALQRICAVFEPLDEDLTPEVRRRRDDDRLEFGNALVEMSCADAPDWEGNGAIDGTLKWSWRRPPGSTFKRADDERTGAPATSLAEVVADLGDPDVFVDPDPVALADDVKRSKRMPSTWGAGDAWVGRDNKSRSVFGTCLHAVVSTDSDGPSLVRGFDVTPANGNPAIAGRRVMQHLHDTRLADTAVHDVVNGGSAQLLGDVTADPAYGMQPAVWQQTLRQLGANPLYRLHRTNQGGVHWREAGSGSNTEMLPFVDGHPMCQCTPAPLLDIEAPAYRAARAKVDAWTRQVAKRQPWRWTANSAFRVDGSREMVSPHGNKLDAHGNRGGCQHCVHADGSPVLDERGRPQARCCTFRSHILTPTQMQLVQSPAFGTSDWVVKMNVHSRIEGVFGVAKSLATLNWGRPYHHFVGLARETLVAALAVMAYNDHMLAGWQVRQALGEDDPFMFYGDDELDDVEPVAGKAVKPPKGMPFLADPPHHS